MSTHTQRYLFEAGLLKRKTTLLEMSAKSMDLLAPEEGLEVAKKAKIKGKLNPSENWSLTKIHYLEGAHGEAAYETCANCSKNIRYVCMINGDEDSALVGPDCALTLLKIGDDIKAVEDFIGRRVKKNKFVKNATKYFQDQMTPTAEEQAAFDRALKLLKDEDYKKPKHKGEFFPQIQATPIVFASFKNLNRIKNGGFLVEVLRAGKPGTVYPNVPVQEGVLISRFSTKKWIEHILTHKIPEMNIVFEKLWSEQITLREKNQFFNPKTTTSMVSDFLDEFSSELDPDKSAFEG